MSVVRLRTSPSIARSDPSPLPRRLLDELHALLSLDPIGGGSAARTLFVVSPERKARLAQFTCPTERQAVMAAPACVVVGYDFPFAVSLAQSALGDGDTSGAIRTARHGAALQGATMIAAAAAVGIGVTPLANVDAGALRAEFFAGAGATVIFVGRLTVGLTRDLSGSAPSPFRRGPCPTPFN
jgi:3-hydroxypropanoate dehydrogenase